MNSELMNPSDYGLLGFVTVETFTQNNIQREAVSLHGKTERDIKFHETTDDIKVRGASSGINLTGETGRTNGTQTVFFCVRRPCCILTGKSQLVGEVCSPLPILEMEAECSSERLIPTHGIITRNTTIRILEAMKR
jgi:hypothetical protein